VDCGKRGEILETELSFEYANAKHSENGKDSMSAGLNVPVSIHNTGQEPSAHICVLDADKDQRDSYPTKTNLLVFIKSHNQSSLLALAVSFMFIYKCNTDPQVSTPKQSRNLSPV
jgi:hypothetical protein